MMEIIFFVWILCMIVACTMADERGRSGFGWLVLSLFLSPVVGIILLVILGETYEKRRQRVAAAKKDKELRKKLKDDD